MPNYDYKCESCLEVTEHFFPIDQGPAPAVVCKCGAESFRQYSNFGIHLKGGGWGGQ